MVTEFEFMGELSLERIVDELSRNVLHGNGFVFIPC